MLPDWVPTHCLHCLTYMGHDEAVKASCPHECNHSFDCRNGAQFQCPTCGHQWQVKPPEDWDGSPLIASEREIEAPPIEHADRLDESPLYTGEKWTRENIYG